MAKCHGQRDQLMDVSTSWVYRCDEGAVMDAWVTNLAFVFPPLLCAFYFLIFLCIATYSSRVRACFEWCSNCSTTSRWVSVSLNEVGTCKGSFLWCSGVISAQEPAEGHMSEVELMLGFFPHANLYALGHLLHFDFSFFSLLWPWYTLSISFSCINLPGQSFRALPRYADIWVPNPKEVKN